MKKSDWDAQVCYKNGIADLLRCEMNGQAADDGDLELDPLGAGGVVRVTHVPSSVLDPRGLQYQDTGAGVDPFGIDDDVGPRHRFAKPEIHGRWIALRYAEQHDRLTGAHGSRANTLDESRWLGVSMFCNETTRGLDKSSRAFRPKLRMNLGSTAGTLSTADGRQNLLRRKNGSGAYL